MAAEIEGFRLSPQQKRLWVLQQAEGFRPRRASCAVTIRGALDAGKLERAIRTVIAGHEILRTSFPLLPGMSVPVQVIGEDVTFSLRRHDLTAVPVDAQALRLESIDSASAGDADESVVRADLISMAPERHRLLLSVHPWCADRPSLARLVGDVAAAYGALAGGPEAPAIEGLQYADVAEWRNQLIESEPGSAARAYWQPFDEARIAAQPVPFAKSRVERAGTFAAVRLPIDLPADAADRIGTLAERHDLSASSFLLACWQTLLARLTGVPDVVVGTSFDGRKVPELESSIGLLSAYVPIRGGAEDGVPFITLWTQVADREREAHRWQEYFAWEGTGSYPFGFERCHPPADYAAAGVVFAIDRQDACTDRIKVKVVSELDASGVSATLECEPGVLSVEDARRLAAQLRTLIEDASKRPEIAPRDLDIVEAVERHRVLVEFNDRGKAYVTGRTVHALIEARAADTPAALAVVYEADQLSYGALDARADQLAHHLIACGVGPDVPVGLCVERSTALIVGLLGILKAGGAYVPLDPGMPPARLGMLLEDAGASVLVSTAALAEGLTDRVRTDRTPRRRSRSPREPEPIHAIGSCRRCEPRVRHLHVGLDRAPEGCRRRAPAAGQLRRGRLGRPRHFGTQLCDDFDGCGRPGEHGSVPRPRDGRHAARDLG